MKVNIGISEKHRERVAQILNELLADEHVLYVKTRSYHWNVVSTNFSEYHDFFEEQYTLLEKFIDEIAERVRQIGHFAKGTMKYFVETARLSEDELPGLPSAMIQNLLGDHESIIRVLRENIGEVQEECNDDGTADFLTGLMEKHEKMAWMLRAYLP